MNKNNHESFATAPVFPIWEDPVPPYINEEKTSDDNPKKTKAPAWEEVSGDGL